MDLEILIIDDDRLTSLFHEKILGYSGIAGAPKRFHNAVDALNFLKNNSGGNRHYLIFLDLNMPVMDGWSFIEKLEHSGLQHFQFVVVTAVVEASDRLRAGTCRSVVHFLEKPMNTQNLKQVLDLVEKDPGLNRPE